MQNNEPATRSNTSEPNTGDIRNTSLVYVRKAHPLTPTRLALPWAWRCYICYPGVEHWARWNFHHTWIETIQQAIAHATFHHTQAGGAA